MLMKFKLIALLLCLFIWVQAAHSLEKTVGLWSSLLWFNDRDYRPWEQYVRYFPTEGIYNSYDVTHIDRLIKQADDIGIDYLILDNTNGAFRNHENDRTIKLILQRLKFHRSNLKISIAIGFGIYQMKDFKYFLREIAHIKKYLDDKAYFREDNKPLLILYINPQDTILQISKSSKFRRYIDANDKYGYRNFFSEYSIRYASGANDWLEDSYGLYGWQFKWTEHSYPTMGVMPGWNRSHNQLIGSSAPIERNGSDFYSRSWMNVIGKNPKNVVITSWDDWAEETAIAPSQEWGNIYYDITKKMIRYYKSNPKLQK
jgi:hypothetical protein